MASPNSITYSNGVTIQAPWMNAINNRVLNDVANVKDYGALGDGSTNDATALAAAINSGKKYVYFPDGTYITNTTLLPKTQQSLIGSKRAGAVIKASGALASVISYPSGTYSGITIASLTVNGNSTAAVGISMIGSAQGAFDQLILCDVEVALCTTRPIYQENATYWVWANVLTSSGSDGTWIKTGFNGRTADCIHYNGTRAALILENSADNDFGDFANFNNPGTNSTSLIELIGNCHDNVFHDYTLEPQGAANVTQEILINNATGSNCVANKFIGGRHIGLANTKTRSVVIGTTGTIYQTRFENCSVIKPTGNNSILLTQQQETQFINCRDLVAYDTPNFSDITITNSSGNPYLYEGEVGNISAIVTNSVKFPVTQVISADPNTLDDYEEANVTLTLTGAGSNPTNPSAVGGFSAPAIKIGRHFQMKHNFGVISYTAAGTGVFQVTLPFSVNGMCNVQGTFMATAITGEVNGTNITFYPVGSGTAITWAGVAATGIGSLIINLSGISAS